MAYDFLQGLDAPIEKAHQATAEVVGNAVDKTEEVAETTKQGAIDFASFMKDITVESKTSEKSGAILPKEPTLAEKAEDALYETKTNPVIMGITDSAERQFDKKTGEYQAIYNNYMGAIEDKPSGSDTGNGQTNIDRMLKLGTYNQQMAVKGAITIKPAPKSSLVVKTDADGKLVPIRDGKITAEDAENSQNIFNSLRAELDYIEQSYIYRVGKDYDDSSEITPKDEPSFMVGNKYKYKEVKQPDGSIIKTKVPASSGSKTPELDKRLTDIYTKTLKAKHVIGKTKDYNIARELGVEANEYLYQLEHQYGFIDEKMKTDYNIPNDVYAHYKEVGATPAEARTRPALYGYSNVIIDRLNKADVAHHKVLTTFHQILYGDIMAVPTPILKEYKSLNTFEKLTQVGFTPFEAIQKLKFDTADVGEDGDKFAQYKRRVKSVKDDPIDEAMAVRLGVPKAYVKAYNDRVTCCSKLGNDTPYNRLLHIGKKLLYNIGDVVGRALHRSSAEGGDTIAIGRTVTTNLMGGKNAFSKDLTPTKDRKVIELQMTPDAGMDKRFSGLRMSVPKGKWTIADTAKFIMEFNNAGGSTKFSRKELEQQNIDPQVVSYLFRHDQLIGKNGMVVSKDGSKFGITDTLAPTPMFAMGDVINEVLPLELIIPAIMTTALAHGVRRAITPALSKDALEAISKKGAEMGIKGEVVTQAELTKELESLRLMESLGINDAGLYRKGTTGKEQMTSFNKFTQRDIHNESQKAIAIIHEHLNSLVSKASANRRTDAKELQQALVKVEQIERKKRDVAFNKLKDMPTNDVRLSELRNMLESLINDSHYTGTHTALYSSVVDGLQGHTSPMLRNIIRETLNFKQNTLTTQHKNILRREATQQRMKKNATSAITHFNTGVTTGHTYSNLVVPDAPVALAHFKTELKRMTGGKPITNQQLDSVIEWIKTTPASRGAGNKLGQAKDVLQTNLNIVAQMSAPNRLKYELLKKYSGMSMQQIKGVLVNKNKLGRVNTLLGRNADVVKRINKPMNVGKGHDLVSMTKKLNSFIYDKKSSLQGDVQVVKHRLRLAKKLIKGFMKQELSKNPKGVAFLKQYDDANTISTNYYQVWGKLNDSSIVKSRKQLSDFVNQENDVITHDAFATLNDLIGKSGNVEETVNILKAIPRTKVNSEAIDTSINIIKRNYLSNMFKGSMADHSAGSFSTANLTTLSAKLEGIFSSPAEQSFVKTIMGHEKYHELELMRKVVSNARYAEKAMADEKFNRLAGGYMHYIAYDPHDVGLIRHGANMLGRSLSLTADLVGHLRNRAIETTPLLKRVSKGNFPRAINFVYSGKGTSQQQIRALSQVVENRIRTLTPTKEGKSVVRNLLHTRTKAHKLKIENKAFNSAITYDTELLGRRTTEKTAITGSLSNARVAMRGRGNNPQEEYNALRHQLDSLRESRHRTQNPQLYADDERRINENLARLESMKTITDYSVWKATNKERLGFLETHSAKLRNRINKNTALMERNTKRIDILKKKSTLFQPTARYRKLSKIIQESGVSMGTKRKLRLKAELMKERLKSIPNLYIRNLNKKVWNMDKRIEERLADINKRRAKFGLEPIAQGLRFNKDLLHFTLVLGGSMGLTYSAQALGDMMVESLGVGDGEDADNVAPRESIKTPDYNQDANTTQGVTNVRYK